MDTVSRNMHGADIASTQDNQTMNKPAEDAPEHEKCRWWREEMVLMTRDQLSGVTGFSVSAIRDFENGVKEIDPMARKRYLAACGYVAMGVKFDWLSASLELSRPAKIIMQEKD